MMKRYCLVSFCNIYLLPYARKYIDAILASGAECDLIYWDRDAVNGENDIFDLSASFQRAGVQHLSDACAVVEKDGAQLVIAGLGDASAGRTPYEEIGGYFNGEECVIAVAHNPSAYIGIRVAEARGGGPWADMVLAGHNLGGQIKLFGKTMRSLP